MSSATVTVRYDGPVLADHRMDVSDLAPALLGISELCKLANAKFNGDRSAVKVLIGTDIEHKCFQFSLDIVQTAWEHAKSFLHNDDVKSAKEILEWLGIAVTGGGTVAAGLFAVVKRLRGRRIESVTTLEQKEDRSLVRVTIEGDNNSFIIAHSEAVELLRDQNALDNVAKVVRPLLKEGYDHVEFESSGKVTERIDQADAATISELKANDIEAGLRDAPQTMTVWITVYSPVYDAKAPKWRFKFGEAREYVDISETDIASKAIQRGGSLIDDAYRVELEITQEHRPNGAITNHYKVKKVLEFRPARLHHQSDAFRDQ